MPVTGMYELCMNGTKVEKLSSDCVLLWSPSAACTYAVSAYMTGTVLALPSHIAALPLEPSRVDYSPELPGQSAISVNMDRAFCSKKTARSTRSPSGWFSLRD